MLSSLLHFLLLADLLSLHLITFLMFIILVMNNNILWISTLL